VPFLIHGTASDPKSIPDVGGLATGLLKSQLGCAGTSAASSTKALTQGQNPADAISTLGGFFQKEKHRQKLESRNYKPSGSVDIFRNWQRRFQAIQIETQPEQQGLTCAWPIRGGDFTWHFDSSHHAVTRVWSATRATVISGKSPS